jgi:hypothetical protein
MAKRINENIRKYLPNDPYFAEVDNLPIEGLLDNDIRLQDQVDEIKGLVSTSQGRTKFNELKPYLVPTQPGKVFITPGSFQARQTLPATRETGLSELRKPQSGDNPAIFNVDTEGSNAVENRLDAAAGIGRMSIVQIGKDSTGADQSITIPGGSLNDFYSDSTPPKFRVDLVFAKGTPSLDTDFGGSEIGIVKGAFFLEGTGSGERTGILLPRFQGDSVDLGDEVDLTIARILSQRVEDVQSLRDSGFIRDKVDPETGNVLYTSVPCPDVINLSNPAASIIDTGSPTLEALGNFADYAIQGKNYFGLPIAYIFVPFTYVEGSEIPAENLLDIRPFFTTNELTLGERQSIAFSYLPGVRNRMLTLQDPKIQVIDAANDSQDLRLDTSESNIADLLTRVAALESGASTFLPFTERVNGPITSQVVTTPNTTKLPKGKYLAYVHFQVDPKDDDPVYRVQVLTAGNVKLTEVRMYMKAGGNGDDDGFGHATVDFEVTSETQVKLVLDQETGESANGITFSYAVVHGYAGLNN